MGMYAEKRKGDNKMLDVLVTVLLMGVGALMVIAIGAIFIAAIFYIQDGGKDD